VPFRANERGTSRTTRQLDHAGSSHLSTVYDFTAKGLRFHFHVDVQPSWVARRCRRASSSTRHTLGRGASISSCGSTSACAEGVAWRTDSASRRRLSQQMCALSANLNTHSRPPTLNAVHPTVHRVCTPQLTADCVCILPLPCSQLARRPRRGVLHPRQAPAERTPLEARLPRNVPHLRQAALYPEEVTDRRVRLW
jgi:hypothetical protein